MRSEPKDVRKARIPYVCLPENPFSRPEGQDDTLQWHADVK